MGGWSDERDISLKTGQAIARALQSRGWHVIEIDVDRNIWEGIKNAGIHIAFLPDIPNPGGFPMLNIHQSIGRKSLQRLAQG